MQSRDVKLNVFHTLVTCDTNQAEYIGGVKSSANKTFLPSSCIDLCCIELLYFSTLFHLYVNVFDYITFVLSLPRNRWNMIVYCCGFLITGLNFLNREDVHHHSRQNYIYRTTTERNL